jgi:hypothetical protein
MCLIHFDNVFISSFISFTPFPVSPMGRAERQKIAQWTILATEPVCRGAPSPMGEG